MKRITAFLLCWFLGFVVVKAQNDVPENPRAMAEWEEVQAVVVNWGDFIWQRLKKLLVYKIKTSNKFEKDVVTCIIHAFSLMQMRGIGTCRHSCLFQAFRNEAGALK